MLPLLLVFVGLLVLVAVLVIRFSGRALSRTVEQREEDALYIKKTGGIPARWLQKQAGVSADEAGSHEKSRKHYGEILVRLDELCQYYERMRSPEDPGEHALMLSTLRRVRAEWANREPPSLDTVPPDR